MVTGQEIVCLSSQDWNDLWTKKQRFMQRFARQGNRVLYGEAQVHFASVGVWRADKQRLFRWLRATNILAGIKKEGIIKAAFRVLNGIERGRQIPEKWDGKAAERIVKVLLSGKMND